MNCGSRIAIINLFIMSFYGCAFSKETELLASEETSIAIRQEVLNKKKEGQLFEHIEGDAVYQKTKRKQNSVAAYFEGEADPIWIRALKSYLKFRKSYRKDHDFMNLLAQGQEPQIMVVACSDSRVDPGLILQTYLGDLFIVRNVANIVPVFTWDSCYHGTGAALEYGVQALHVKHLIILGHSQCGGVKGALEGVKIPNYFITPWISQIQHKRAIKEDKKEEIETEGGVRTSHNYGMHGVSKGVTEEEVDWYAKEALNISYANCFTYPFIRESVARGELIIHRWFFDIKTATLFIYSEESHRYEPLNEKALHDFLVSQGYNV